MKFSGIIIDDKLNYGSIWHNRLSWTNGLLRNTKQIDNIMIPNRIGYNIIIFSENYVNVL